MKVGKTIGVFAGLVTIIVGGIAIYQFINPKPPPRPSPPPKELSFLEKVAGTYSLASWVPAHRRVSLGIRIPKGSLEVQNNGTMDWSVLLEQIHAANPSHVRMTARGRIQLSTQRVTPIKGGEYNNTHYLDTRWGQVSFDVTLAVRGWNYAEELEDLFQVATDEGSGTSLLLEMANSRGTFTWRKN